MNLSASSLGVFSECNRCFYYEKKLNKPRPRGIFPSLPGGMDGIFKKWSDTLRADGQPVPIVGFKEKGEHLFWADAAQLKKWRHWKTGLKWEDGKGNTLIGALDEALLNSAGQAVPADFKTKGSETDQESVEKYYQRQIDCYALLLSTQCVVSDYGIILSFYPEVGDYQENGFVTNFIVQEFMLAANPDRIKEMFAKAIHCLSSDLIPPASKGCEYCNFAANRANF